MNARTQRPANNDNSKIYCYLHPEAPLIDNYDSGDIVCPLCGLVVVDRVIDIFIDSRHYSHEDRRIVRSCVGSPENYLLHSGSNLSTSIALRQGDNLTETDHATGFYLHSIFHIFNFWSHSSICLCFCRPRFEVLAIEIVESD